MLWAVIIFLKNAFGESSSSQCRPLNSEAPMDGLGQECIPSGPIAVPPVMQQEVGAMLGPEAVGRPTIDSCTQGASFCGPPQPMAPQPQYVAPQPVIAPMQFAAQVAANPELLPMARVAGPPAVPFLPAPANITTRPMEKVQGAPQPVELKEPLKSLFSQLDLCDDQVVNKQFVETVNVFSPAFLDFTRKTADAKEATRKLLTNYGIIKPGSVGRGQVANPDPAYLIRTVEEALDVHEEFKEYIKKLLNEIERYISTADQKIEDNVKEMKEAVTSMVKIMRKIQKVKDPVKKNLFMIKHISELVRGMALAKEFRNLVAWRNKMDAGLSDKL